MVDFFKYLGFLLGMIMVVLFLEFMFFEYCWWELNSILKVFGRRKKLSIF